MGPHPRSRRPAPPAAQPPASTPPAGLRPQLQIEAGGMGRRWLVGRAREAGGEAVVDRRSAVAGGFDPGDRAVAAYCQGAGAAGAPSLDPVLLVPGIGGSILQAVDEAGNKEGVWVRILARPRVLREALGTVRCLHRGGEEGDDIEVMTEALARGGEMQSEANQLVKGVNLLVATPGRLLDYKGLKALDRFNTAVVSPIYDVMFTSLSLFLIRKSSIGHLLQSGDDPCAT